MTSGLQPPSSGAPVPVPGVTGGPPVLGGQISNDPNTGNVVVAPNPGQVLQVRKGNNPTALQVYEYFHTNTDYSRIALNSQTGGPFSLAVETAPSTVIRGLNITANGPITITGSTLTVGSALEFNANALQIAWPSGGYINSDAAHLYIVSPGSGQGAIQLGGGIVALAYGGGLVQFSSAFTTTATLGAASALPATPALYFTVLDSGGVQRKIPAYNV